MVKLLSTNFPFEPACLAHTLQIDKSDYNFLLITIDFCVVHWISMTDFSELKVTCVFLWNNNYRTGCTYLCDFSCNSHIEIILFVRSCGYVFLVFRWWFSWLSIVSSGPNLRLVKVAVLRWYGHFLYMTYILSK